MSTLNSPPTLVATVTGWRYAVVSVAQPLKTPALIRAGPKTTTFFLLAIIAHYTRLLQPDRHQPASRICPPGIRLCRGPHSDHRLGVVGTADSTVRAHVKQSYLSVRFLQLASVRQVQDSTAYATGSVRLHHSGKALAVTVPRLRRRSDTGGALVASHRAPRAGGEWTP
jgi:hypothetical protein